MKKNLKTPTHIVGKRKQGFLVRMATKRGRKLLRRRRQKGRKKLTI
jgi:large subunit ribosomal protein L34